MADRRARHRSGQFFGEHVDGDDRFRPCVREHMRHLGGGVERVDIDEDAAGLEDSKGDDRIGEAVRRLDRDARSGLKAKATAQIGGEGVGKAIDVGKAEARRHAVRHDGGEGPRRAAPRRQVARGLSEQPIGRRLDFRADARGIVPQPRHLRGVGGTSVCRFARHWGRPPCLRRSPFRPPPPLGRAPARRPRRLLPAPQ